MKLTYQNFNIFKKDLYHFENIEELYSKLMNILSLICFQTGYYYCFCNQYSGCELSYDRGLRLCPLCQISVHFVNFEEELDKNQHNLRYLKQFAHELYPFLEKCYKIISNLWKLLVVITYIRPVTGALDKKQISS